MPVAPAESEGAFQARLQRKVKRISISLRDYIPFNVRVRLMNCQLKNRVLRKG